MTRLVSSSKHALQPGRPITKEELISPVLVGRDQPVMIVYQSAGITASMPGVALKKWSQRGNGEGA